LKRAVGVVAGGAVAGTGVGLAVRTWRRRKAQKVLKLKKSFAAKKYANPEQLARLSVKYDLSGKEAALIVKITNNLKQMDSTITYGRIVETIGKNSPEASASNIKGTDDRSQRVRQVLNLLESEKDQATANSLRQKLYSAISNTN